MELLIETLLPTVGHVPINGTDTNGRTYTEWELGDEASFDFTVPNTYVTGEDIVLVITESSTSASKNHKWRFTVGVKTYSEITHSSLISNATASTIDTRTITISHAGTVESYELQAGDVVSVTITRIEADSDEDSASIRLYTITANLTTSAGATTACLGRLGGITAKVFQLFNDDTQRFVTDAQAVASVNECLRQIAIKGYFSKCTNIDIVANQQTYNLITLLPDYEELVGIRWNNISIPDRLVPIATMQSYWDIYAQGASGDRPYGYHLDGDILYITPVPTSDVTGGMGIHYRYLPSSLSCTSNYTPPTPAAHDSVYVYYALTEAYARDRHSPMAQQQVMYYQQMFTRGMERLMATQFHPGDRVRSYR